MSRHSTEVRDSVQEPVPSPPLPADHVLSSGAVLFPGAFDQYGCPLIVFPVDGQDNISSQLSKAEVVDFINYFLCLHKKKQEKDSLVSVVADLRHASPNTTRFIAETLLLLELHKRKVHTVYIIQPQKKDVVKLLQKVLTSSAKSCTSSFKKVLLKEVSELSNYIDKSQLFASLGGYHLYCHQSWVTFIKEIDAFVQEFLSVVQRLPSCICTLRALSRLPLPSTFSELQHFCSTNEAKFQQLRRELGLDELLRHCESVLDKLRYPERDPCYQAMAGTALFTHTAYDMLQNHSRITAAVGKVDQLWQQAFSKARLQLQVFQLREDALQITEQTDILLQKKLQPYKIEIADEASRAEKLVSEFQTSIHTPAVALVRRAEGVINTLAEILPLDGQTRERWALDLKRLKEKLHSAVHFILQNLRAVSSYHQYYSKAHSWYSRVLSENLLHELLSGVDGHERQQRSWGTVPAWRQKLSAFLKRNPPPHTEELVHLAHLSTVIPDDDVKQAGRQTSQRCMTLRKLLTSAGPVSVSPLQLALQWQYELLRSRSEGQSSAGGATKRTDKDVQHGPSQSLLTACETTQDATSPSTTCSGTVSAEGKPPSLSSFDSGFDGAGSSHLEAWGGKERAEGLSRTCGTRESVRPVCSQPRILTDNISRIGDSEGHREVDFVSAGNPPRASIQVLPQVTLDSLNLEIKVTCSAAPANNPWLSLPVDLENSYTVNITQSPTPTKRDLQSLGPSDPRTVNPSSRCRDQPTQTDRVGSTRPRESQSSSIPPSQSLLGDPQLSPIGRVLSSTITEERDQSGCTTEGIPTLLWDSYDLHDLNQESVDSVLDVSVTDWDVKEQEGLREVEKMLVKTDEILEEEENVLTQEVLLDVLLRSEDRHWPAWDSEDQLGVMSSSELAAAGVIGLEDCFDFREPKSTGSASETKISVDELCTEAATGATPTAFHRRLNLLTELREVHVLDELILKENLEIHELRSCEQTLKEKLSRSQRWFTNMPLNESKERETFREQLEREKREVEILEKSLETECRVKHKSRARKVVTCSIMEKAKIREDQELCDELLSGVCHRGQRSQPATAVEHGETETSQHQLTLEVMPRDSDQCPNSSCQENPEVETSVFNQNTLDSCSDVQEPLDEVRIQPQACLYQTDSGVSGGGGGGGGGKPETSLMSETRPDDGAFDPGGGSRPCPLPMPRQPLLLVNGDLAEHETLHSSEVMNSAPSSVLTEDPTLARLDRQGDSSVSLPKDGTPAISHNLVLSRNVKEQSNNNNNNHALSEKGSMSSEQRNSSAISTKGEEDASVPPVQVELHLSEEDEAVTLADTFTHLQSSSQVPHHLPLEFDPGGRDELKEDLPDVLQSFEVMRISSSGSPEFQVQLNVNIREMTDFQSPIVLDTGSGLMKAGFAHQDLPNVIFPTIIGQPKYEEIMNGNVETFIGHEAQHMRGVLALKHPIKNGIICNWDEMETIWHHTFQQLCVDPEDHPVLLTEAAMNPLNNRQRMVEIMFECFNVPFTYVAMQAVLALYAAGRCTGVVLDSGDGVSHSVPVFEGYCLPHAVQRFPLAGGDVTMQLKRLLQEQGVCMRTTAEMEIVREMKEKCCCVALDYEAELSRGGSSCREMRYTMPDGQVVTLSTERFRAPEVLFKPELIGRDHVGMHESVYKSVVSSDIDLRRCFLGNIVLSGGNTLLADLPERLRAEIKGLMPADMGTSVFVTSPKDRDFSVWCGGAALANLHTSSSAWISQEEYEEFGPQIVFRKCF